tara:strand:- start:199 stop:576 length:378 start_codon:yes stop_codon:yes gene_type:complete
MKKENNFMYGKELHDLAQDLHLDDVSVKYVPHQIEFRYNEDEMLNEVLEYIKTTYQGHYVGKEEIQTTDVWHTLGSAMTTTRDTAIKYLMRYGKKGGYNKKDLLKAIHYIVLLSYFTEDENDPSR